MFSCSRSISPTVARFARAWIPRTLAMLRALSITVVGRICKRSPSESALTRVLVLLFLLHAMFALVMSYLLVIKTLLQLTRRSRIANLASAGMMIAGNGKFACNFCTERASAPDAIGQAALRSLCIVSKIHQQKPLIPLRAQSDY